jgi:HSP20 family molecular chaperone IbpA
VDKGRVDAMFEDGVLTVSMPKTEAAKTKLVKVKPRARKG